MASTGTDAPHGETVAQQLLQKHAQDPHPVVVEEVSDEDLPLTSSAAPADESDRPPPKKTLDTESHELFPELGAAKGKTSNVAPIWGAKAGANGKSNGPDSGAASRSSTPSNAPVASKGAAPSMFIPGRNVEFVLIEQQHILPRSQLKRPIPDIIKDINRKSRANITMSTSSNGHFRFDATGPQDVAQQALKDLIQQIGTRTTIEVRIPMSSRAHIIGKGGSMIKSLQEKTGAKIQLPKLDETQVIDEEDDDATIDVIVEGNTLSAASARNEILKIAGERSANIQTKVRGVPAAFFPFISGQGGARAQKLEEANGVQVRIPAYETFGTAPTFDAAERPQFTPAVDNYIQLAGDRAAVQKTKAEIEAQVAQLQKKLHMEQLSIQRGRHQFIIGDHGVATDDFFNDTNCAIILPTDKQDDTVTIIGFEDHVQNGVEKAMDLAMGMQMSNLDIGRLHRTAVGGPAVHAAHVTRYLHHRNEIKRIEKQYNTHINTPINEQGALPWELYSRDGKNAIRAQSEITGIVHGHPPSRIQSITIDPFFHQHLHNNISPLVKKDFGVQIVVPDSTDPKGPILLVYEGADPAEGAYQIPRTKPTDADAKVFKKGLGDACSHVLNIINQQESLSSTSIDVPVKYHLKLRQFLKKEQEGRVSDQFPIRVTKVGTTITLRGPASAVKALAAKAEAFVEQEKQDDKERGFTLTFDFPQKFANHLIGKGGSNIRELRDRFDVEIQVQDGKVELKGPKAKAESARAHIQSLSRTLEDEITHVLRIDPKFHREMIGAQGAQINRLQTRYKVLIFFPRSAKPTADDQDQSEVASESGKKQHRQQAANEVIIRGPKRGADEARDEVFSLYKYLEEHSHSATVSIQQKQVGSLIGQGGAGLDELRQLTGARIDVPADRDNTMVEIMVKGTAAQVSKAKKLLEEKRAVFDDTVVEHIEVDKKHHKALIGSGGATLREIVTKAGGSEDRRELARTIQFPKQEADGNLIKVEGRTEVVANIVKRIKEIVAERESQITEMIEVPVEKHRSLIGRNGDIKRQMEAKFSVSIDVPPQGSGKTGVKLVGRPEKVAAVKEHIAGLMQAQKGETMQIPRNIHHSLSNGGSLFRQLRNNHQVTVDHAGHVPPAKPDTSRVTGGSLPLITDDEESTADAHSWKVVKLAAGEEGEIPWVLMGTAENVAKAKETVQKALEQVQNSGVVGYLVLPDPRTYRYVIGPNGTKVNAIRRQSGCKIQVPRDQAKDEAIEITGTAEGVDTAKDLILAAVREGQSNKRD